LDFSSFLVKEVTFRPIEISQKVNLFFLKMYWKHGEIKKAECKCPVRFNRTYLYHDLSTRELFDLQEKWLSRRLSCKRGGK